MHTDSVKRVIVIGGDGTLHEVVNGLSGSPPIPIGFIPAGTGNDFARGAEIKKGGVERFKEIILNEKLTQLRLGEYRQDLKNRVFLNSLGVGLDGAVVRKAALQKRKTILPYVSALLKSLSSFKEFEAEVIIDKKKLRWKRFTMIIIANHPYFGKGMKIAPQSSIDNQEFSVLIVEVMSKWKILFLFISVFFGYHTRLKKVHEIKGKSIQIYPKEVILGQADGQPVEIGKCAIRKSAQKNPFILKV